MFLVLIWFFSTFAQQVWIRINQLGYQPSSIKCAVMLSVSKLQLITFSIHGMLTNSKITKFNVLNAASRFNVISCLCSKFQTIWFARNLLFKSP